MDFILNPNLVLYLPLWKLDGSSFMSKDACGHLCTVTGALWRPDGRYFDGVDDKIEWDAITVTAGSLEGWFMFHKLGTELGGVNNSFVSPFYQYQAFDDRIVIHTTSKYFIVPIVKNQWHHLVFTWTDNSDSDTAILYFDTVAKSQEAGASGTILVFEDIAGKETNFNGLCGEVRLYNRVLTPQEIQHNYLATKWRYR